MSILKRAAFAALVIVLLSGTAVAASGLLVARDFLGEDAPPAIQAELQQAPPGRPQTLLLMGSDERFSGLPTQEPPRSDTLLLVRLDPELEAINVLSIPRDLRVDIPGHGRQRINRAYTIGGERLVVKTIDELTGIRPNHVINVQFNGFQRAVNAVGGVYIDIDRRYFNDNTGPGGYAAIDLQPGYQLLPGSKALDYVRYRHEDTDLVRAARQQDFLRQAREQGPQGGISSASGRDLAKQLRRYVATDRRLRSFKSALSLGKLLLDVRDNPVRQLKFPVTGEGGEADTELLTSQRKVDAVVEDFFADPPEAKVAPRRTSSSSSSSSTRRRRSASARPTGLVDAKAIGRSAARQMRKPRKLPVYVPGLLTRTGQYASNGVRSYKVRDGSKLRDAYKLVVETGAPGEFYGVQGLDWDDPPILAGPHRTVRRGGRTLELFSDGSRLRLVAWRTEGRVYWVSNTLTRDITNARLVAIAASLAKA